jgi:hypothetical protein
MASREQDRSHIFGVFALACSFQRYAAERLGEYDRRSTD